MSHVKRSDKDRTARAGVVGVKTGGVQQRVAPATPNCTCEPERRPQSSAAQPARASARTLDGESARRLTTPTDSSLTSNTVAHTTVSVCMQPAGRDALCQCARGNDRDRDDRGHRSK